MHKNCQLLVVTPSASYVTMSQVLSNQSKCEQETGVHAYLLYLSAAKAPNARDGGPNL